MLLVELAKSGNIEPNRWLGNEATYVQNVLQSHSIIEGLQWKEVIDEISAMVTLSSTPVAVAGDLSLIDIEVPKYLYIE